jgi:hypothetical protein
MTSVDPKQDEANKPAPVDLYGPGGIFMTLPAEMPTHEYLRPLMTTKREKSWGEKLTYETGICYLSGTFPASTAQILSQLV